MLNKDGILLELQEMIDRDEAEFDPDDNDAEYNHGVTEGIKLAKKLIEDNLKD